MRGITKSRGKNSSSSRISPFAHAALESNFIYMFTTANEMVSKKDSNLPKLLFHRDISFMYDCVMHGPSAKQPAPSKNDPSSVRVLNSQEQHQQDTSVHLPDSIVPDEYRIVKNQGVWPLKIEEK